MSREEKRKIRLELNDLLDRHCGGCEFKNGYENHRQCLNDCPIGEQLRSLTAMLVGDINPNDEEVSVKKGRWEQDEVNYLINHLPYFSVNHLAMRLNRDPKHVSGKIHRIKAKQKSVS